MLVKTTKNMKKLFYALLLSLVVVSGLLFASHQIKTKTAQQPTPKIISAAERQAALKEWEATPAGIQYKKWEASPAGQKVYASEAKIKKQLNGLTNMQAIVTSLTLPPGTRLGFAVMVQIEGEDYILSFGPEINNQFKQLHSLQVNDKIIIRSRGVSHAPKYAYPIVAGDYVERDSKLLYKRPLSKDGC
jgi:hypothetical protein